MTCTLVAVSVQTHPTVLAVLHMSASAKAKMWVDLLISEGKRLNFDDFDGVRHCRARLHCSVMCGHIQWL